MLDSVRLYLHYAAISIRAQMQYKASFVMMSIGHFVGTGIEFIALWALFDRFQSLRGWTLPQAAFLYGIVHVAFALSEAFFRGFDVFHQTVKNGDFDRTLLRPRSTVLQMLGQEAQLMRIGRFAQGLAALLWAAWTMDVVWTPLRVLAAFAAVTGGAALFSGLFVLQATLAFWTVESLEIVNTMTYGGVETGQYPMSIYKPWFRRFFTFVVPLACINYYPTLAITGAHTPDGAPVIYWLAPAVGFIFLLVSLRIWRIGVRHYCSTGS